MSRGTTAIDSVAGASPRRLARMAGALYLINIGGGAFAISIVPALIVVQGDIVATANNVQSHELLYRLGLAAHVVVTVTNIPLAVIFYDLFKAVNRRIALLDAFFILVATAIEAASLVNQFATLALLGDGTYSSTLSAAQRQALAYLPGDLSHVDYALHTVFFGFDILCMAYLVLRSGFLPRALGVLLALDGLAYLVYSFTDILAPGFAADLVPWIQLPALLGEGGLCLWLLIVGLDVERWEKWATPTLSMPGDRHGPGSYEIRVKGHLDSRWGPGFDGMGLTHESDGATLIHGPVVDQAALPGLLQGVRDTGLPPGLPPVSVTQVEPEQPEMPTTDPR